MITKVVLVGGFHEIIELCNDCNLKIVGIIDNDLQGDYYGVPVIGNDDDAKKLYNDYKDCKIILTPDSPRIRKKLYDYYKSLGYRFATVISPLAKVSDSSSVGEGTVIQAGVNVSSATQIGRFCKLNTYCNVMHDNIVGDFVTIAPNAVSLGRVTIEESAYIGANSTILPSITIGEGSSVGAGAVVTRSVDNNTIVKGIPAK